MTAESRKWLWRCAGFGLLVILNSLYFGLVPDAEGCPPHPELGAVIAFEIVRSPLDVAALFGEAPCTGPFTEAMRHITWVDAILFIPAYTLFLVSALIALRKRAPAVAWVGIAAAVLAALSDQLEGVMLFRIMDDLPGRQGDIDWLILFVRAKFALLAVAAAAIGLLIGRIGRYWSIAAFIITVGAALTVYGVTDDAQARFLASGSAISWATILLAMLILLALSRGEAAIRR